MQPTVIIVGPTILDRDILTIDVTGLPHAAIECSERKSAAALDLSPRVSLELRSLLPYPNSCLGTSPHQQGRVTRILSWCAIDDIDGADRHSGRHSVAIAR